MSNTLKQHDIMLWSYRHLEILVNIMFFNSHDLLVTAIICSGLAVYIIFMVGWCIYQHLPRQQIPHHLLNFSLGDKSFASGSLSRHLVSSFKYKKDIISTPGDDEASDLDCVICLLEFEDGEELQQLPRCKHSFHAPCISMWLYSHSDCPLCREPVEEVGSEGDYL